MGLDMRLIVLMLFAGGDEARTVHSVLPSHLGQLHPPALYMTPLLSSKVT